MPKLTLKQRKFIKSYIQSGNATQAAKDAGYQCKSEEGYWQLGSQCLRKLKGDIDVIMDEIGLDDAGLAKRLLAGCDASTPKNNPDWFNRMKFTELALKAKGLLKDRVDHVAWGTITIRVKGRDYGKVENKPIEIDAQVLEIPEKVER